MSTSASAAPSRSLLLLASRCVFLSSSPATSSSTTPTPNSTSTSSSCSTTPATSATTSASLRLRGRLRGTRSSWKGEAAQSDHHLQREGVLGVSASGLRALHPPAPRLRGLPPNGPFERTSSSTSSATCTSHRPFTFPLSCPSSPSSPSPMILPSPSTTLPLSLSRPLHSSSTRKRIQMRHTCCGTARCCCRCCNSSTASRRCSAASKVVLRGRLSTRASLALLEAVRFRMTALQDACIEMLVRDREAAERIGNDEFVDILPELPPAVIVRVIAAMTSNLK